MKIGLMLPLGEDDVHEPPPENAIAGDADEVGRALAEYRSHGMDHLTVHLWPRAAAAVTELARAAEIARADARIGAHG